MGYKNGYTGEELASKAEYMTSLNGNSLVYKNHPQIILRGYLDELKSKILVYMWELEQQKKESILRDFHEILVWVKLLQRHEVTGEPMRDVRFNDMDLEEIRNVSHNPKKYYNLEHLFDLKHDENIDVLKINELRAFTRRIEIVAFDAFFDGGNVTHEDFLTVMNRLSSVFYIVELKIISGREK